MSKPLNVLFLCTGNSCRSQMAEAWTNHLKGANVRAQSAGTHPKGIDPRAVEVMSEVGLDLAHQSSKSLEDLDLESIDVVVSVCSEAERSCPQLANRIRRVHVGFEDPPRLTAGVSDEAQVLRIYRRVRDEIRAFVETLPESLAER